jgi:hypothetical protein
VGAANADLIVGRGLFGGANGVTAAQTEVMVGGIELVVYSDAIVKHKAVPLPQARVFRHGPEVVENATFEVINLLEALGPQVGRGLFTANATGAEHRHFFVLGRVEVGSNVVG